MATSAAKVSEVAASDRAVANLPGQTPGEGRLGRVTREVYDIIATEDADTTVTVSHGLGVEPGVVSLVPLHVKSIDPGATGQRWIVASKSSSSVVLTKTGTGTSSGDAAVTTRVILEV